MQRMLACSLGVAAVCLFPKIPSLVWLSPLAILALLSLKYKPLKIPGALCFGLIWGVIYAYHGLHHKLPDNYENIDLEVTGRIVGLPKTGDRKQRFDLKVSKLRLPNHEPIEPTPRLIRLNWYQTEQQIVPGELWRFQVRLKRPRGLANPETFDYETWLFRQGIDATGYVRDSATYRKLQSAGISRLFDQLRFVIHHKLNQQFQYRYAGVLKALLIGERSGIDTELWQLFTETGTNHLFVISGLHVGFIALCGYWLIMRVGRWLPLGAPVVSVQQVAAVCAVVAAALYSTLAGFALPTQRALIMLVLLLAGQILKRSVNSGFGFFGALLFVLLWDPLAPRTVGFWLSFGAVGTLLLGFAGYTGQRGVWWRWGRPQWLVFVAFIPLLLGFFSQFSLLSPLANMVAIPLVGMLVVPLCLLGGALLLLHEPLGLWLLSGADGLLALLLELLRWLADSPVWLAQFNPGPVAVILACFGALILLMPRGLPARWLALFCFLPLFTGEQPVGYGNYRMQIFDVGQGLSVLLETDKHRLLYDVGPRYSESFNAADAVLLPYFSNRNIGYLDRIVISHSDNDHAGSLRHLVDWIDYGDIISGSTLAAETSLRVAACRSGSSWTWDGVEFRLMQAQRQYWSNENNRSCVLRVDNGRFSVLLTGDIERDAERSLIKQFGQGLRADFMLAPHHGSRTSSSIGFLRQVAPGSVVFTAGYKNRFGHPKPDVVERYRKLGIVTFNTADEGAIKLSLDDAGDPVVERYRETRIGYR